DLGNVLGLTQEIDEGVADIRPARKNGLCMRSKRIGLVRKGASQILPLSVLAAHRVCGEVVLVDDARVSVRARAGDGDARLIEGQQPNGSDRGGEAVAADAVQLPGPLIREEEEELVLDDRSAECAAELILLHLRRRVRQSLI